MAAAVLGAFLYGVIRAGHWWRNIKPQSLRRTALRSNDGGRFGGSGLSRHLQRRHRRWDDAGVSDGPGVLLVHPWLGELRWYQPGELIGSIDLDPVMRPPRSNGHRDVEVLLHVMPGITDTELRDHVDRCAARIRDALR
jgi:hypothetical protein